MLEIGYLAQVEARSDWLTIETVFIAEHLGVKIENIPKMAKEIRSIF
jgi:hypothetical protein